MASRSLVLVVCGLLLVGCGTSATESSEYRDLEVSYEQAVADLAAAEAVNAELAEALDAAASQPGPVDGDPLTLEELPPAVAAFKAAYESGDFEQVKALYAEDGIITSTGNTHELYWGGTFHLGTWDKEGAEFLRLASIHHGEMQITQVIEMDGVVAFDWDWEDFASGTAVLHLRDDEIVVAMLSVSGDRILAP
jgi:hypothetical protein